MRVLIALALVIAIAAAQPNPRHCGTPADGEATYYYNAATTKLSDTTSTCLTERTDNCAYAVSPNSGVPTTLRTANGDGNCRLEAEVDGQTTTDYVYLAFNMPDKYYNHQLVFADKAVGQCAVGVNGWERVDSEEGHETTVKTTCSYSIVYRAKWSDAYQAGGLKCGWESGTNPTTGATTLTLDFGVTVDEDIIWDRDGMLQRTITFSHPVRVEFPTQVTATPVDVQVFSPLRPIAAITNQAVTINEDATNTGTDLGATLDLVLFTEVQDPFELTTIGYVTKGRADIIYGAAASRVADTCSNTANDCSSEWNLQYKANSLTGDCDFDGDYSVDFTVKCSDDGNLNCPIDTNTDSVTVSFSIVSSHHCPIVIDTVDLSAVIKVFDSADRDTVKDDFVGDGTDDTGVTADLADWQVAYFRVEASSVQVQIEVTELNQVWITRDDPIRTAENTIVILDKTNEFSEVGQDYDNDGDTADDYDGVDEYATVGAITCAPVAYGGFGTQPVTSTAVNNQGGCTSAKPGTYTNNPGVAYNFNFKHGQGHGAVAGDISNLLFQFDMRTDNLGFNMGNDAIEDMTVRAVLDVTYSNSAKRSAGNVQADGAVNRDAAREFRISQGSGSSSTSSSSSALMSGNVLMGAAALAAIAVIAVVAIVVRRRRSRPAMQKVESTAELTSQV